eukprot:gene1345-15745_t
MAVLVAAQDSAKFEKQIKTLEAKLTSATRQLMLQQFFTEETRRADGNSGLKQLRYYRHDDVNYNTPSHVGRSVAAIHDHANNDRTVGMGEFIAVLNGVEFRTRHNDYRLYMPHRNSSTYGATEPIPFPEVPPSVLKKTTLKEQIDELHNYFKAWRDSDYSNYDYRKYFQAVLCYLEGAWTTAGGKIDEPFESDRHFIDAANWFDLQERVRYTSYTGTKSRLENLAYLPTTVMEFVNESIPVFAQWNYRIACHPVSHHVPLSHLELVEDMKTRMYAKQTREKYQNSRSARFRLNKSIPGKRSAEEFLDVLMGEIPGKNNYPGEFYEKTLDGTMVTDLQGKPKDVSRYHRIFKTVGKDAMGQSRYMRGFSDNYLFSAKTNQSKVAGIQREDKSKCTGRGKDRKCPMVTHRYSYAIPLEMIYLTPLTSWNFYNLTYRGSARGAEGKKVTEGGRNGDCKDPAKHWNGLNSKTYYMTPKAFFSGEEHDTDAADTTRGTSCVLDPDGKVRQVVASGTRIMLPEINGVGKLRTRYPIFPVYGEGSPIWKELNAVIDYIMDPESHPYIKEAKDGDNGAKNETNIILKTGGSRVTSTTLHHHTITLTSKEAEDMKKSGKTRIFKTTSHANGHEHDLKIFWSAKKKEFLYETCDNMKICWDKHAKMLVEVKED